MLIENNPYISRFDDEPSLINPMQQSRFEAACGALSSAMPLFQAGLDSTPAKMVDDFWFSEDDYRARYRPYIVKDGILQVPIKGVLLNNFGYQFFDFATGYQYVQKAIERGTSDDKVKGIALIIDSPGGEVAGNFDLVDYIYEARGKKQIRGIAAESAYSAAYSIISATSNITVARTGGVGSIGVVTAHLDISEAMSQNGYKLTWIFSGKHKVDGNMYEPLKPEVKKRIQGRIDELRGVFAATVARNLGMDEEAVLATEALTFTASEAVSNGLAHEIGSVDQAMAAFAVDLEKKPGVRQMTITAEDLEKAVATAKAEGVTAGKADGIAAGKAEGLKEGATAERARISGILASDEGKKRPKAALSAALKSDMTLEAATEFLADLDEEKPAAAAPKTRTNATSDAFSAKMEEDGNADIGEPGETEKAEAAFEDRFEKAMSAATGKKKAVAA